MLSIGQIAESVKTASAEYPIKKAELFGSYASGENRLGSDVDILIEFFSPSVSLLTLNSVKYRLEELLQTEVDLVHAPVPPDSILEIDKRITLYGA